METRVALIAGTGLLSLSALAAAVAAVLDRRGRRFPSLVAALPAAVAALLLASILVGRWMDAGRYASDWFGSLLTVLSGISGAAAFLAGGSPSARRSDGTGFPALASASAVALAGVIGALFMLRADDSPLYGTPATTHPPAGVFLLLHPFASGFLLATAAPAAGLLLTRSDGVEACPWDAATRRMVHAGLPLLVAGIVAEAAWHGAAWGSPWSWDLSETWPLLSLLVFVLWLHLRQTPTGAARPASGLLVGSSLVHLGFWWICPFLPGAVQSLHFHV